MLQADPFCDECGAFNQARSLFCHACGHRLPYSPPGWVSGSLRFCDGHCSFREEGKQAGSRFCRSCGESLTNQSSQSGTLPAAQMLKQRYGVVKKLGEGGFGAIYLAEDKQFNGALRALKEMHGQQLDPQEWQQAIAAFKQEAMLLANLMHPNLPRIYDHFEEGGRWYLVMDYIEGETLEERQAKAPEGKFSAREVLPLALQLCTVLNYLHSRQPPVIFRDLKPANVMVTADDQLYLIDFGIARIFKRAQGTDTVALGTPGYAAPEQYGAQSTTASDIYGLGATLHHLLTGEDPGKHPFNFSRIQVEEDYDASYALALADLVQQMVRLQADQRPSSVQQIKQELLSMERQPQQPVVSTTAPIKNAQSNTPTTIDQTLQPGETLFTFQKGEIYFSDTPLVWLTNSQHLMSGGYQRLRCWDIVTGTMSFSSNYDARHLTLSPGGAYIAAADLSNWSIFSTATWQKLHTHPLPADFKKASSSAPLNGLNDMAWSPDGCYIAFGTRGGYIYLWDVALQSVASSFRPYKETVRALCWSPDGKYLAVLSARQMDLFARSKGTSFFSEGKTALKSVVTYVSRSASFRTACWSLDGKYIAVAEEGRIAVCAPLEKYVTCALGEGSQEQITALSWSPDSRYIASASTEVRIWDIWEVLDKWKALSDGPYAKHLHCLLRYAKHQGFPRTAGWSPDGKYIASVGDDRTIHVWQAPV